MNTDQSASILSEHLPALTWAVSRVTPPEQQRALEEIGSHLSTHNSMVDILQSPQYMQLRERVQSGLGPCHVGAILCIDGRIPDILFSVFSRWEVPGGFIATMPNLSDVPLPRSARLSTRLRDKALSEWDLVELVVGHRDSFYPDFTHGCAAFTKLVSDGGASTQGLPMPEAHLVALRHTTARPVDAQYDAFRPGHRVSVVCSYDTATAGLDLDLVLSSTQGLSSTRLIQTHMRELQTLAGNVVHEYGYFGQLSDRVGQVARINDISYFMELSEEIVTLTDLILNSDSSIPRELTSYISKNHRYLTDIQRRALVYLFGRTIAFQYLTGFATVEKDTIHGFRHHDECAMSISLGGPTILDVFPQQSFVSTAAEAGTARLHVGLKHDLIRERRLRTLGRTSTPLYISTSVELADFVHRNAAYVSAVARNVELARTMSIDSKLHGLLEAGLLIIVPVLVDGETGHLLEVTNLTGLL